ncbi:regulating synaptic membrane exocytosis protein 1-like isoform X2 [Scleropages formosus]|uniref:regulating synaptic membrane exocytosis protein 1-like isoform X2 n=1 Tax=Scleropages formosus TaxID=113540 RepID=UPI0010FAB1D2|nr:regulating synaptic membrane exocytosis protein 1-like isoform X2 [Scleropages formosus]
MCGHTAALSRSHVRFTERHGPADPSRVSMSTCRSPSKPPWDRRTTHSVPLQNGKGGLAGDEHQGRSLHKVHSKDHAHCQGEELPQGTRCHRACPPKATQLEKKETKAPSIRRGRRHGHSAGGEVDCAKEAGVALALASSGAGDRERTAGAPEENRPSTPPCPTPFPFRELQDRGTRQHGSSFLGERTRTARADSNLLGVNRLEALPSPCLCRRKRNAGRTPVSAGSSEEEEEVFRSSEEGDPETVGERGSWRKCHLDTAAWPPPVLWQPSKEGDRLIGRITLSKGTPVSETGGQLGLKVVGGKVTDTGELGAFITKVKRGSLADVVGHLQAGDEVLLWNGKSLPGSTKKEVYNIILESKMDPQVEIVVSRSIRDAPRVPEVSRAPSESRSASLESPARERLSQPPRSFASNGTRRDPPQLSVKLCYDNIGHQLVVNVLQASDLPARPDGRPRNPYVKMYLLPDRSDKSKRRSKTVKKSLAPRWNQTFLYSQVQHRDLRERTLELSVWDQPRAQEEESHPLGEVLIELELAPLDDRAHWYELQVHDGSTPTAHPPRGEDSYSGDKDMSSMLSSPERQRATLQQIDQGRGPWRPISGAPHSVETRRNSTRYSSTLPPKMPLLVNGIHKDIYSSTLPACLPTRSRLRLPRSGPARHLDRDADEVGSRARSSSTSCLAPDEGFPSPEQQRWTRSLPRRQPASPKMVMETGPPKDDSVSRIQPTSILRGNRRAAPLRPIGQASLGGSAPCSPRPDRGAVRNSPCTPPDMEKPPAGRRVRQLPQVPVKGSCTEEVAEDRSRQRPTKASSYQSPSASNTAPSQQRELKGKRQLYGGHSSGSVSDSELSDASATSRRSSASHISSGSYASVQSEQPRGRARSKSLESCKGVERRERRISWGVVDWEETQGERRRSLSGDSRRRHSVAGDLSRSPSRSLLKSTSVSGEIYALEHGDGSQSDPAPSKRAKQRRASLGARVAAVVSRSRSTSQLHQAEANRKPRGPIQRSQETGVAAEFLRQPGRECAEGAMNSYSSEGNLLFLGTQVGADGQFSDFLDGLGPAQLVGRQTLATPAMGDIQMGLLGKKTQLEVEVIRARGLTPKPGSRSLPAPYVKVYLLDNGICRAKKKTKCARKTLDPLYQQVLLFEEGAHGKMLQVIVWGDYGRMDHKCFMGVAQILLEELDLSSTVIGWYKLFPASSLVDPTLAPLSRRASQLSLDVSPGLSGVRS